MQNGGYGRKYNVKPRFYIFLVLILGLSAWGLFALLGFFSPAKIEWGRLSSSQSISAIVLRDETVVEAKEYGKLSCVATEGEPIAKDATVALMSLTGFSENDIVKLAKLQNDIKDYQQNNIIKASKYADLDTLNSKINEKMSQISGMAISRQTQGLAVAEQDLRTLINDRVAYMKTIVKADEPLDRMYQQEAALEEKINSTRKAVTAPLDGFVSYYLDGYESELTVASIDKMTPATMKALMNDILKNNKPFKSEITVAANQPICRIVSPAKWYAIVVTNAPENQLVQGTSREVTFDGMQKTVNANVLKVMNEGRTSIAVLEISEGTKEMLSLRLINGHLGQDIEGFRVPLNMVAEENGRAYIRLAGIGNSGKRVEVTLLGRDDKYAIIKETNADEGLIAAGLQLLKP